MTNCYCIPNLNEIKEFVNISFWIFTAILAYKTYKNAKKTLLREVMRHLKKLEHSSINRNNQTRKRYLYESPLFVMNKLLFNQEVSFVT